MLSSPDQRGLETKCNSLVLVLGFVVVVLVLITTVLDSHASWSRGLEIRLCKILIRPFARNGDL